MTREAFLLALDGLILFEEAWTLQRALVAARQGGQIPDVLILLEHQPVVTIGRSGDRGHLLMSREVLAERGVPVFDIERGGSVTYHGPGQLVIYYIFDLTRRDRNLHQFMSNIQQGIIDTLFEYGITAKRGEEHTGIWVEDRKIASI